MVTINDIRKMIFEYAKKHYGEPPKLMYLGYGAYDILMNEAELSELTRHPELGLLFRGIPILPLKTLDEFAVTFELLKELDKSVAMGEAVVKGFELGLRKEKKDAK